MPQKKRPKSAAEKLHAKSTKKLGEVTLPEALSAALTMPGGTNPSKKKILTLKRQQRNAAQAIRGGREIRSRRNRRKHTKGDA